MTVHKRFCQFLEWDSNFFGFPIGRVQVNIDSTQKSCKIDDWARVRNIRCLYYLCDSSRPDYADVAQDNGYRLIDVRTTLEWNQKYAPEESLPVRSRSKVRTCCAKDIDILKELARTNHQISRFFRDPNFPRARSAEMYATWIEKCCTDELGTTFLADLLGKPVGYISVKKTDSAGEIILAGVDKSAHRQGVGSLLVQEAVKWLRENACDTIRVVTQGTNLQALRLYNSYCFLPVSVEFWFHKWYD